MAYNIEQRKQDVVVNKLPPPKQPHREPGVDTCWYMAGLCALVTFMTSATIRSSGFLYIGMMEEFRVDRGQAAWPICLFGAVSNLAGIVAGPLCQRFGPVPVMYVGSVTMWMGLITSSFSPSISWMTATLGILFGFGSGIVFMMLFVFINQYFDKYKGLALGIMYTGSTSSAFVFPKLLLFLKETYNFRSSVMIFGAIVMHVTAISLVLKEPVWIRRKKHQEKVAVQKAKAPILTIESGDMKIIAEKPLTDKPVTDRRSLRYGLTVLKCPMFYVIMVTYIIYNYNFDVFMTTVPDFAVDRGTSVAAAVGLVPLFSITDTVGRLGLPVLADRGYLRRSTLVMVNYLLMGLCLLALPWSTSYASMLVICLCVATFVGCGMTMYPAIMAEYVGLDRLPISYGIVGTVAGPLFLLKPFLIGYFRDNIGAYDRLYTLLASALVALTLIWLVVVCAENNRKGIWRLDHKGTVDHSLAAGATRCQYTGEFKKSASTNRAEVPADYVT
ncbi:monocarboxylate transporter 12-like [Dermacentor variabilis]|uniref:monocarboxylate transporter 12-like n=1 Tax=Dermacentor variabilis TaxID=34621 RepID=UPI003F5B894B